MDNMIQKYEPSPSTTGAVAQNISSKCLSEHDFTFYSDLTGTAEEVLFENTNPVEAILGEGGPVEKYGAELARDWFDVFLVQRVGNDTDVQIREGKNLLGISYDVDLTDVVTRIMPTGEDKDGNVLYLPELYIDSPNIGSYPNPKWIHLLVSEAKEVAKGEDKKSKRHFPLRPQYRGQSDYRPQAQGKGRGGVLREGTNINELIPLYVNAFSRYRRQFVACLSLEYTLKYWKIPHDKRQITLSQAFM